MTKKQLRTTLLSFGLCGSLLMACTKKENADAEKAMYNSQTARSQVEMARNAELNAELAEVMEENKKINEEVKKTRIQVASLKYKARRHMEDMEKQAKEYAFAKAQRNAELTAISKKIEAASVQLTNTNILIERAQDRLANLEYQQNKEKARIAGLRAQIKKEKAQFAIDLQNKKAMLAALEAGSSQAIAQNMAKADAYAERARAEADVYAVAMKLRADEKAEELIHAAVAYSHDLYQKAEKQAEEARKELESKAASMLAKIENRNLEVKAEESRIKAEIAELEKQQDAVATRESKASEREAMLTAAIENLKTWETNLSKESADLDLAKADFKGKVEALRALFVEEGYGDTFAAIEDGARYTFRVRFLGQGSASNIQWIRAMVKAYNDTKGLKKDNNHKEVYPVLVQSKGNAKADRKQLKELDLENAKIFKTSKDIFVVNDEYLVNGTAVEVKGLLDKVNNKLAQFQERDMESAYMLMNAYPVDKVRVRMTMDVYGSSKTGHQRALKKIVSFKIADMDKGMSALKDIDLSNPGQYVLKGQSIECSTVDTNCLVSLKKTGLLDQEVKVGYVNSDGVEQNETLKASHALENLIAASIEKLSLQRFIRRIEDNGGIILNGVMAREASSWYERVFVGDYVADQDQLAAGFEDLESQRDKLEKLIAQPIVEKIEISYEIAAVENIKNIEDGLSLKFAVAKDNDTLEISNSMLLPGEVELKLPIDELSKSSSNFIDLTLEDFSTNREEPTAPKKAANPTIEEIDAFDIAQAKYVEDMIEWDKGTRTDYVTEYERRSDRLSLRLEDLLEQLRTIGSDSAENKN